MLQHDLVRALALIFRSAALNIVPVHELDFSEAGSSWYKARLFHARLESIGEELNSLLKLILNYDTTLDLHCSATKSLQLRKCMNKVIFFVFCRS